MTQAVKELETLIDKIERAICRETCAFMGEKPCFSVEGQWPNPNCNEPGCHALAEAIAALELLHGIAAGTHVIVLKEPEKIYRAGDMIIGERFLKAITNVAT